MSITISKKRAERLLDEALRPRTAGPNVVLAWPSLEQVQTAIATGPEAELHLLWTTRLEFNGVTFRQKKAELSTTLHTAEVTLTHISNLDTPEDWSFYSFTGSVYRYDDEGNDPESIGYWRETFIVTIDPKFLSSYRSVGFGRGVVPIPSEEHAV
jgi:hypothetical protein